RVIVGGIYSAAAASGQPEVRPVRAGRVQREDAACDQRRQRTEPSTHSQRGRRDDRGAVTGRLAGARYHVQGVAAVQGHAPGWTACKGKLLVQTLAGLGQVVKVR